MASKIRPELIRTDLGVQSRVALDTEIVREYAEEMEKGTEFPPLRVFFDLQKEEYILADGFHRYAAHLQAKPNDGILVTLETGTLEDAKWASIGANKSHGLRRTNDDKRNAVTQALLHPKGAVLSDSQIAKHVVVSHTTVQNIRRELELSCKICKIESRIVQRGGQTYRQNTTNIGTSPSPAIELCADCEYFHEDGASTSCELDNDRKIMPWSPGCEDFEVRFEREAPRDVPPPDYDNVVEHIDKPKSKLRLRKNRNLKDCMSLELPKSNPMLFAIELRNAFDPGYLLECFTALKGILEDNE